MDLSNKNIIHIKNNGIEYIQFRKLLQYKELINHAYCLGKNVNFRTSRVNKENLEKGQYESAINNYKELCNSIESNYINIVKTNQEHTKNVQIVNRKYNNNLPDINLENYNNTDGLVTNKTNLVLSTTNADCILLLFFYPVKKVIANVHSGWKGTLQRISVETVQNMKNELNCDPKDIICCICPSIRKCHFEVDKDIKDKFEEEFSDLDLKQIIEKQKDIDKWNIDTVLINQIILQKEGLQEENIIDSGICSVCNSKMMHSFRVEKEGYGLNTALIELKEESNDNSKSFK